MSIPVWVEQTNGTFSASVYGTPALRAEGETKDAAIAALLSSLNDSHRGGEIVWVDMPASGPARPGPLTPEEAEAWHEVVESIYRERDEQKRAEFSE